MRKRFLFASLFMLYFTSISAAFSSWLILTQNSINNQQKILQDDIEENYSFYEDSNKKVIKDYTIYLFPSTLYLNDYINYLENNSDLKPEELYGYIEPKYDLKNDIMLNENGNTLYNVVKPKQTDSTFNGDVEYIRGLRTNYNSLYLGSNSTSIEQVYETSYKNDNQWYQSNYYSIGNETFNRCYIGDPILDVTNRIHTEDRFLERNQHRYDRFGFWSQLAYNEGRYLPIKINVKTSFSYEDFEQAAQIPFTSMGDSNSWYNYTSPCWAYIEHSGSKYTLPSYATAINNQQTNANNNITSAFRTYDIARYFDLMKNFDKYADSNNVIRLFPTFSNGKNPRAGSNANQGGRDAVRMQVEYKSQSNSLYNDEWLYTMYTNEQIDSYKEDGESNATKNIKLAMYSNLNINNFKTITYQVAWSYGSCNWSGEWPSVYTLDENIIEKIKDLYGDGLYNFYFFMGNNALNMSNSTIGTSLTNLPSKVASASPNDNLFSDLQGKVLLTLDDLGSQSSNSLTYLGAKNTTSYRPIRICIEKIRTIKIITETDATSEQELQNNYTNINNVFRFINDDIYEIESGSPLVNDVGNTLPINKQFPYCYIIRDIDFTELSSKYLQIRFQRRYRKDLNFAGTDGPLEGNDPAPNTDIIYDPLKEDTDDKVAGFFEKEQRFVNAFGSGDNGIFKTEYLTPNGSNTSQLFLSLKNEEMKGIYDFLIIYRPIETTTTVQGKTYTHKRGIYLYAYRHTNLFIKILANDVSQDNNGFAIHKSEEWKNDNALLFQKEYPIGVHLKPTDLNEVEGVVSSNYSSWLTISKIGYTLEECINNYVDNLSEIKNNQKSKGDIVLRDHVTQTIVAYYKQKDTDYILNFENFKSRKNYIFYVTFKN